MYLYPLYGVDMLTVAIIYFILSLIQGAIMRHYYRVIGLSLKIGRYRIPLAPLFAAWGIGWVITPAYLLEVINLYAWLWFFTMFSVSFGGIIWGSATKTPFQESIERLEDSIKRLQKWQSD